MKISKSIVLGAVVFLSLVTVPDGAALSKELKLAPDFRIENLFGGAKIDLKQHRGSVVYVDFWASWCGPCLKSFPYMESLHQEFGENGLVIIAVNMDQEAEDAHRFLEANGVSFLIGRDGEGLVAEEYGVEAMPSSFVINREGFVEHVHSGFRSSDKKTISSVIANAL